MAQHPRPNIVIVNPDQWRGDALQHRDFPGARTPVLDELVRTDAVSVGNAFCQNPVCTPSRCSFMTGWYPHVRGHRTMHHMLHADEPNLLAHARGEGYHVWWGGKNDLVPGQEGFDRVADTKHVPPEGTLPSYGPRRGDPDDKDFYSFQLGRLETPAGADHYPDSDWSHVEAACGFIDDQEGDQPFLIYLPLLYPHPPYTVEDPWFSMIDRATIAPPVPVPDHPGKPAILDGIRTGQGIQHWQDDQWRELRANYLAMGTRVDHQLGMILAALRRSGHYDNTLLLFFSDHGDFTGDYGLVEKTQNTFEDCLTRVPLVIKPPATTPVRPGLRQALVELVDLYATVEDLAGLTPTHTHFGRSLVPLFTGPDSHRDAVFCEGGRLPSETHTRETESLPADPAQSRYWPRLRMQQSDGPEHLKATMCRTRDHKLVLRMGERDELYDLHEDPHELINRSGDAAFADVEATLRGRLLDWFQQTADVVPWQLDQR